MSALARIPGWIRFRRARLSLRLALLASGIAALAVGVTFWSLSLAARERASALVAQELARSQRTLLALHRRAVDQSLVTSWLLTRNPTLTAAVETMRLETRAGAPPRAELVATVQGAAEGLRRELGEELLLVLDEKGRVSAAATAGARVTPGLDLGRVPAVVQALDPASPIDSGNVAVLRVGEVEHQLTIVPMTVGDYIVGALAVGHPLGGRWAESLKQIVGGEVELTNGARVIASTLPASVERSDYQTASMTLGRAADGSAVRLRLHRSIAAELGALRADLALRFALAGLAAALLVGLGTALVSTAVLRPLGRLVRVMREGAAGTRVVPADPRDEAQEVRSLSESYAQLIDAIEQQHRALVATNADLRRQFEERERTERALRESESQLRQAQKLEAIGTLAGGVAHDFNNLLSVISGYTQIAVSQLDADDPARQDLREVVDAADRAALLTTQLLAFSRRQVLQPRVLELDEVVEGMERMLRRLIGAHIELTTTSTDEVPRVCVDRGQLEQVLMNLVVNARDAMPTGGTIRIELSAVGDASDGPPRAQIVVRDSGIGMDAETRARIFEPFFSTKAPGKGTGLGLATVYGIVTQSGGTIAVESAPGAGAAFILTLPSVDAVVPAAAPDEELGEAGPRGTETVLVVEDDDALRALVERVLRGQGYRVLLASNGEEAMRVAAAYEGRIELLLTDVVMPRMSGPETATRILAERPDCSVLFVSGYADDAIAAYRLDPDAPVLHKPFTPQVLAKRVRASLDAFEVLADA